MRILRVEIHNFRGVSAAAIDLGGHALFVGPNNACKTTILEALDLALGPDRGRGPDAIDEHDFHRGSYYQVVLTGEDASQDEEIGGGGASKQAPLPEIRIVVTLGFLDDEERMRFRGHLEPWHRDEKRLLTADELEHTQLGSEDYVLRVGFRGWYDEDEDDFDTESFFLNPAHPSGARDAFGRRSKQAVGFLYLRSFRTARRAASLARGSLLETLLRARTTGTQLWESLLRGIAAMGNALDSSPAVRAALDDIETRVRDLVPLSDVKASGIHVNRLTRQHLRDTLTYFLASEDSDHLLPYDRLGSGTSNALVLALLAAISEAKANVIFAMEEPEIALPPHAQRSIVQLLRGRAEQALVTSHSPYVAELFLPTDIVVVRRGADGRLSSISAEATPDVKEKALRRDFRTRFAEGMLAKAVLLVEGPTELWALPAAVDVLSGAAGTAFRGFDLDGLVVLPADGTGEIPKLAKYFRGLGVPVHVFCDNVTSTEDTAIRGQSTSLFTHQYGAFEPLVAKELPVAALRRMVRLAESWPDYPVNIVPLNDADSDDAWRERCEKLLKMRKGEGWAQRFLSGCAPDELPVSVIQGLAHLRRELGHPPLPSSDPLAPIFRLADPQSAEDKMATAP